MPLQYSTTCPILPNCAVLRQYTKVQNMRLPLKKVFGTSNNQNFQCLVMYNISNLDSLIFTV